MSKFVILLAGPLRLTTRAQRQCRGARIVAADGGIRHAEALGLTPELWIGDFDSAPANTAYDDIPREPHPAAKDATDGELAVRYAIESGASEILMVGALGGRTDHALGNLLLGMAVATQGVRVVMTSGNEEAVPLGSDATAPDWPAGTTYSILAMSDLAGLTQTGCRWPQHDVKVPFGATQTISNVVADRLVISLQTGRAVAIAQMSG